MAQKVQKVRRKLEKKGFDGIECTEVGKCIRLEGEMTEWTDIVKAGKAAAKFGYKGVLNDISLKGFTEPAIRAPKFTDGSLSPMFLSSAAASSAALSQESSPATSSTFCLWIRRATLQCRRRRETTE